MQYTEQELAQLVKSLEKDFEVELENIFQTAGAAPLAKAEDDKKPSQEEKPEEKKPSEEKPEESEENESSGEEAAEAAEGDKKPEAKPDAKPEAPVDPSADEGASGYDAEDIAHMDAMYMSMSKAELLAHHDSCVRALEAIGAEHTHAAPAEQAVAPAEQAVAPQQEIDKCGDMQMTKSEQNAELELAKSEAASFKAKAEELQKSLDTVNEFLTKLVKKAPQGKAITQYEQVAKSETVSNDESTLSKSEISAILNKKASDPTLKKSDRDAINNFYLGNANINTISHLLK